MDFQTQQRHLVEAPRPFACASPAAKLPLNLSRGFFAPNVALRRAWCCVARLFSSPVQCRAGRSLCLWPDVLSTSAQCSCPQTGWNKGWCSRAVGWSWSAEVAAGSYLEFLEPLTPRLAVWAEPVSGASRIWASAFPGLPQGENEF